MENEDFYFENTLGDHSKFWAIGLDLDPADTDIYILTRRWGKIGENGRTMQERFNSFDEVEAKRKKLISEKQAKGYRTVL